MLLSGKPRGRGIWKCHISAAAVLQNDLQGADVSQICGVLSVTSSHMQKHMFIRDGLHPTCTGHPCHAGTVLWLWESTEGAPHGAGSSAELSFPWWLRKSRLAPFPLHATSRSHSSPTFPSHVSGRLQPDSLQILCRIGCGTMIVPPQAPGEAGYTLGRLW